MTTVGFGEVYPRTEMGRVIATATMLSGILLIALPVAIIGRKFQEVYEDHQREEREELGDEADIAAASKALRSAATAKEPMSPIAVQDGPTLSEMSKRMRVMKLPDANMIALAVELADELHEAAEMQQEIYSMEKDERERQSELIDHFGDFLTRFQELINPAELEKKASGGWGALTSLAKAVPILKDAVTEGAGSLGRRGSDAGAVAPPLPPPPGEPPAAEGSRSESQAQAQAVERPEAFAERPPPWEEGPAHPQPPGVIESPTNPTSTMHTLG